MATTNTGVFPVYENQFKIGASEDNLSTIADLENCSVSFDNGIEEWTPFDTAGWKRRLPTAKSITISISGKRNVGDTGNDFVASLAFKNGHDAEACFVWTFPDGTEVMFQNAVISVTNIGTGDSTTVGGLEFEVQSNGKPTVKLPTE